MHRSMPSSCDTTSGRQGILKDLYPNLNAIDLEKYYGGVVMNKNLRMFVYGFFTWLIPFAFSFLFYGKDGKLAIDQLVFKAIITVIGGIVGIAFLVTYFKRIDKDYITEGVFVGVAWLIMNIALDLLTLVLMFKMQIGTYLTQIGLSYLVIPTMAIGMGYALGERKKK
jgi:hypothetical protein